MFAQDFGDARDFAGADEQIDFRQFGGEFVRIALGEAAGDDEFFYLVPSSLSRATSRMVSMDSSLAAPIKPQVLTRTMSASARARCTISIIVLVQQPGHDFGIDQVTGASQD